MRVLISPCFYLPVGEGEYIHLGIYSFTDVLIKHAVLFWDEIHIPLIWERDLELLTSFFTDMHTLIDKNIVKFDSMSKLLNPVEEDIRATNKKNLTDAKYLEMVEKFAPRDLEPDATIIDRESITRILLPDQFTRQYLVDYTNRLLAMAFLTADSSLTVDERISKLMFAKGGISADQEYNVLKTVFSALLPPFHEYQVDDLLSLRKDRAFENFRKEIKSIASKGQLSTEEILREVTNDMLEVYTSQTKSARKGVALQSIEMVCNALPVKPVISGFSFLSKLFNLAKIETHWLSFILRARDKARYSSHS